MLVALPHPELGPVQLPGVPVELSETPGSVRHLMREAAIADLLSARSERPSLVRSREAEGSTSGPLAGIRVLDLGVIIAVPLATTLLASFGADVIKLEPPDGDSFRPYGLGFVGNNRGKRSVALDLKQASGREAFLDIVRTADVVCDNYRHGVLERLGIDFKTLAAVNPRIVQASVTAYGSRGPRARDPGFDPLLQAESGLMAAQGGDDEPVFHQIPLNDTASAMVTAFGVAAALYARERIGRGQRVETSLANQSVLIQSGELVEYQGRPASGQGDRDCPGASALERFYRCADGWLALACSELRHFEGLCAALAKSHWREDFPAAGALAASRHGPLARAIAEALVKLPRDELLLVFERHGVPAAATATVAEAGTSLLHRRADYWQRDEHPAFGDLVCARAFAEWSRTRSPRLATSPLLGEHSREVLLECGVTPERIEQLLSHWQPASAAAPPRSRRPG
jgi:crotonobetainyl-CoA:carnitine CoA-transferase CaiB-like acyl-CoA transferase